MSHLRQIATGLLALGVFSLNQAQAQRVEYDVTIMGKVPGSYLTYSHGINDQGEVVGLALFIPGGLKAWIWTEGTGFVLLPQPPGLPDYSAVDINNATGIVELEEAVLDLGIEVHGVGVEVPGVEVEGLVCDLPLGLGIEA